MPFPYISSAFTSSSTGAKRDPEALSPEHPPSTGPFTSPIKDDQHSSHPIADSSATPGRARQSEDGYMTFERRDRASPYCTDDGTAERMGEGDRMKGVEGVAAAVVDAVDSIGHDDNRPSNNAVTPISSRSRMTTSDRPRKGSYPSVLTPAVADFAAQYPLTTVAAIGAIGSGVLIGSAAVTALTIRALFRAFARSTSTPAALRPSIQSSVTIPRPDPILGDIKNLAAAQGEILHRMGEWQKIMEPLIRSQDAGKAASAQAIKDARIKMGDVPIAGSLGEARLGQVIRQAMEDVLAGQNGRSLRADETYGGHTGAMSTGPVQNSQMMDSLDRLESITLGITDEIRLLRESKGSNDSSPAIQGNGEGVMSVNELTDMINGYNASIQKDEPSGEETVATVNEGVSQDAMVKPGKKGRKSEVAAEAISTETTTASSEMQDELVKERQFGRAVLGPYAVIDDSLEVAADEMRKAGKGKKKKSKAAPQAATVSNVSSSVDGVTADEAETSPLDNQDGVNMMSNAASARQRAKLGMDDFAARHESSPQEAELAYQRKPTQLPPSKPVGNGRQQDARELSSPIDSGHWSFQLHSRAPTRSSGWHDVGIVLQGRAGVAGVAESEDYWGSFVSSGTSTRYVDARVFFNPEPDMIHLDGGIWRCGREGKEYAIRERIA